MNRTDGLASFQRTDIQNKAVILAGLAQFVSPDCDRQAQFLPEIVSMATRAASMSIPPDAMSAASNMTLVKGGSAG